jgi:hypothetical protein
MYETGLTARKIAQFDTAIFDDYRQWEASFDWDPTNDPKRYLRGDGTHLLYLPVNEQRSSKGLEEGNSRLGFGNLTKHYPPSIKTMWQEILKPQCEYLASITGIADPLVIQADIARMKPITGDTVMHTDTRYHQRYTRRYNIAISTNPDCWLYHHSYDLENGGIRDHINEGEVWELNNKIVHTAVNYGTTWRTHLIIDVMPQNYYDRMCELYNPYAKVPNPLGLNTTYDYDIAGNLIHEPLFEDLPHCFSARTHV